MMPLVEDRQHIEWTHKLCPLCKLTRTMPKDGAICGFCLDTQVEIARKRKMKRGYSTSAFRLGRPPRTGAKFVDRLRPKRVAAGYTQRELSYEMSLQSGEKVSDRYISNMETFNGRMSVERMKLVAKILRCRVDELYTEEYQNLRTKGRRGVKG